jgi:hypothetical protein
VYEIGRRLFLDPDFVNAQWRDEVLKTICQVSLRHLRRQMCGEYNWTRCWKEVLECCRAVMETDKISKKVLLI